MVNVRAISLPIPKNHKFEFPGQIYIQMDHQEYERNLDQKEIPKKKSLLMNHGLLVSHKSISLQTPKDSTPNYSALSIKKTLSTLTV